jgi:non-specific serine/threonine protein kinase
MSNPSTAKNTLSTTDGVPLRDDSGSPVGFSRAAERPADNLPLGLSSFIGREREIAEVQGLIAATRLLTLCGPGGAGKTRLALAVAAGLVEKFEDGVWWVELAPLSDPELVPQAVAQAMMIREEPGRSLTDTLAQDLAATELLLILDNCEHLIGAAASLAEALLLACPNLRVLATSREALNVAGEVSWPVPPLSLPDPRRLPSPEGLLGYESARLFVERARAVNPSFALDEGNAVAVSRICYQLDGIPLAIELAAARMRMLSAGQISGRLEDALGLLTGGGRTTTPRQRTLRATLQWSHDLLSEPEQKLLGRLSVFFGGWTLQAAEAVCSGDGIEEGEVLELLAHLVDKSMVVVTEAGGEDGAASRYRMLEPVRQFALERLQEGGEDEQARDQHAEYYLALAEEAEPALRRPGQEAWLQRLETEHDNFRAALRWTLDLEGRSERGLTLAAALWQFWDTHNHLNEGSRWLERALRGGNASPAVRAKALNGAGWMAWVQGDGRAIALLEESLGLFRELGDKTGIATALGNLGYAVVYLQQEKWRLEALREEAEALRREPLDPWATTHLLFFLTLAAMDEHDYERAAALAEENLALTRKLGNIPGIVVGFVHVAMIALIRGDPERAAAAYEENLRLTRQLRDTVAVVSNLMGLAGVAMQRGEPVRAARLWGSSEPLQEATGLTPANSPFNRSQFDYDGVLATMRSQLGDAAFEAAWAEGRAMTLEEAVEYALGTQEAAAPPSEVTTVPASPLSERETEVLRLAAEGLTDSQVAQRLYVSPRTVGRHLQSVYRKLGVPSRAAAAREASERGLI